MNFSLLMDGKVPARTECPFAAKCEIKAAGKCNHKGVEHEAKFSCAAARGFDITRKSSQAPDTRMPFMYKRVHDGAYIVLMASAWDLSSTDTAWMEDHDLQGSVQRPSVDLYEKKWVFDSSCPLSNEQAALRQMKYLWSTIQLEGATC